MANFQDDKFGQTLFAYCHSCYTVLDAERELYYKCLACDDYILCPICLLNTSNNHFPFHLFVAKKGIPNEMMWVHVNMGVTCDHCLEANFIGRRYKCIDCPDFDVCESCFPFAARSHRLKLAPNPVKAELNQKLLALRIVNALTDHKSPFYGQERDTFTGWSLGQAQLLLQRQQLRTQQKELSNYYGALPLQRQLEQMRIDQERREQKRKEEKEEEEEEERRLVEEEEEEEERKRLEERRLQDRRLQEKRLEEKRLLDKRLEEKRLLDKRLEDKRLLDKRLEDKRLLDKRLEDKRLLDKRLEDKRLLDKRLEEKRLLDKRLEDKRLEERRAEERRAKQRTEERRAEQRAEERRAEQRRMEERRAEDRRAEERRAEDRRAEERRAEERRAEERRAQQRR